MSHPQKTLRVDFHSHTSYSRDSLNNISEMLEMCQRRGIDRLVITDHNTITGALVAKKLAPERIIVGEEIKTTQGELLAVFVEKEVPAGLTPLEAIARLRDQGAFISVSHPFDIARSGHWELEDLLKIAPMVDAIEIFNSRCARSIYNTMAKEFARQYQISGTAGSDAHSLIEIGRACLELPAFEDKHSLTQSLEHARVQGILSPPWVHLSSRYAVWRKSVDIFSSSP